MAVFAGLAAMRATLKIPAYRTYIAGNSVSLVGNWMQRTAIGWLTWQLTGSATWLGVIAFLDLFSTVLVSPFGGVLADRYDRRRLLLAAQLFVAVLALTLFALSWLGRISIHALALLVLLQGLAIGVNQPARLALVPGLVTRERLPTAVAINSIVFNCARFIGPALAGALIVGPGLPVIFLLNALSFAAFIAALLRLPTEEPSAVSQRKPMTHDLVDGLRFVRGHQLVGPLLAMFAGASLLVRPLNELLPGFAAAVHGGDARVLALFSAAIGLGAIVGGFAIAQLAESRLLQATLLAPLALAAAVLLFATSTSLPLATLAIIVCGTLLTGGGISAQSLVQLHTPPELRGRVMSLYGLIFRGAPGLGALGLGALADRVGLPSSAVAGAGVFVVAWLAIWQRRHQLAAAHRRRPPHERQH